MTESQLFQYVCVFEEANQAKNFKLYLLKEQFLIDSLEEEGDTICFIGAKNMIENIERYDLLKDQYLNVERRPAGLDVDEAEEKGLNETFSYYGT